MPSNRKPDVCFETNNTKSFTFSNNAYTLKLNEMRDRVLFRCASRNAETGTVLTIDSDRNSDKAFTTYAVLNDITNIENITIAPADGVNIIWLDGDGALETGKNYIIQLRQISQTTVLASLTNTTLTNKGEEPPPPPPIPQEISAIYFAMPQSETMLYDMFTWYDEFKKSGETPAGAENHEESVKFFVPQITNNIIKWKSFTDYTIEDNMIKVLVKDIDEESFLKALNNEYISFFNLHVFYKSKKLRIKENITVENYPLIWDKNDEVDTYSKITLSDTLYRALMPTIPRYYSNLSISNLNNDCIGYTSAYYKTTTTGWQWYGEVVLSGDGSYIKPDNNYKQDGVNISIKTIFEKGFKLSTAYTISQGSIADRYEGANYEFSFNSAKLNANSIPVMPYGDMTLNYLKFEYKEVE